MITGFMMIAPTVSAQPGLSAEIVFPQPNTATGPFNYEVTQTDLTADATGAAELSGDPIVDGDTVTLTVTGLVDGHEFAFTYTVTGADGITATSAASTPITATT
ncbi:hypothetical protein [Mycobacterium avium]